MPTKRALIVDDSPTAQFKLIKTLKAYDLHIDTVASAEDALSYLSYKKPDVLFMDQSMGGMDGLEAVRIIKSNPETATIPMVMYTAKSGKVFLGQARTVGAIDVLSKEVMTDSDIKRVMSVLKIPAISPKLERKPKPASTDEKPPAQASSDLVQIRDQVANSLAIQQGQFRRELQDNTRLLVNRFMREMRELRQETERQKNIDRDLMVRNLENQETHKPVGISPLWSCILGALFFSLLLAIWAVNNERSEYRQLLKNHRALVGQIETQNKELQNYKVLAKRARQQPSTDDSTKLLRALVWAVNQTGRFDFDEVALGDTRSDVINGLVSLLTDINYQGTLTLNIHNGDFCVVTNDIGQPSLPREPIPIGNCDFLSNSSYSFDQASQISVDFINLLQSYPIVERGDLQINVQAEGLSKPSTRYPDIDEISTSEQWNNVALANNFVRVSLRN